MGQDFRIACSNRTITLLIIEFGVLSLYGCVAIRMESFIRTGLFLFLMICIYKSFISYFKSKYTIKDNKIIVDIYSRDKNSYLIDKITKITYIDTSSKWRPFSKAASHQLAITFERPYLKSIEPRCFFPANRDAFVDAIMKVNPNIILEKTESKYYPFLYG